MAEKEGGAPTDVEDCARLSRALGPVLEAADPIKEAYTAGGFDPRHRPAPDAGRGLCPLGGSSRQGGAGRPIDGRRRFTGVITGEDEDGAHIELDDDVELVAHVHEMSRASLVLTDELIEAARAAGNLPPQPDEDDLGDLEIDETEDETDSSEETGDVQ